MRNLIDKSYKNIRYIPLTKGKFAIVDLEVFDIINKWKWCANQNHKHLWYAVHTHFLKDNKRYFTVRMHSFIWELFYGEIPDGYQIDHKNNTNDNNGLDNRLKNLRLVTCKINCLNRRKSNYNRICTSNYMGVSWSKTVKRWVIRDNTGKWWSFITEEDAAYARDYFLLIQDPYSSNLNFPKQTEEFYQKILSKKYIKPRSSNFYGVGFCKRNQKFVVYRGGDRKFVGYFNDEIEAALAYDRATYKLLERESKLNFPENMEIYKKENDQKTNHLYCPRLSVPRRSIEYCYRTTSKNTRKI